MYIYLYIYIYIILYNCSTSAECSMGWRAIHEYIVANTFRSKKSSLALLVNEQQASQK